jgi:hypothetical protein
MAPQSCLRLLGIISGFTNCPHPFINDGKGGCVEKESGNVGCKCEYPEVDCTGNCGCCIPLKCNPPQFQCGDDCCEIPLRLILIIIVIILTPPFLRSRVKKPTTELSDKEESTKPAGFPMPIIPPIYSRSVDTRPNGPIQRNY